MVSMRSILYFFNVYQHNFTQKKICVCSSFNLYFYRDVRFFIVHRVCTQLIKQLDIYFIMK